VTTNPDQAARVLSKKSTGLAFVALLLLIIIVFIVFPPSDWIPAAQWGTWLESKGLAGIVAFAVTGVLATSMGFPRQMVAFIAGVAYGVWTGLLLSLVAATVGCLLTVLMSRRFLAGWVTGRYPAFIERLQSLLVNDTFLKILVLRLQPLGTNLLTNTCVGLTTLPLRVFLMASAVGYVPQMLVFTLLGSGVRVESRSRLLLSGVMLLASMLLGWLLFKKHQSQQTD